MFNEDNQLVSAWLSSVSKSSARQYTYRFKNFLRFNKLTVKQFLDEAKTDPIKTKTRLNEYYNHLVEDEHQSFNYAAFSESIVKAFLKYHEILIKTQRRSKTTMNERAPLRSEHIKKYVEAAPNLRDKALIMMGFQTGMDISSLLRLNYGEVKDAVEDNKYPFIIRYIRKKSSAKGLAIIGRDSVILLQQYIVWRKEKGDVLKNEWPLFIANHQNGGESIRLTPRSAQHMLRETIVKSGVTTWEELHRYTKYNPYSFHAIRTAFSSIAEKYMPKTCVDYSMGHKLPYNGAYTKYTDEERIEMYRIAEPELSIFIQEREVAQLKQEVANEKTKSRNIMVNLLNILQEKYDMKELQEIAKELLQP